MASPHEAWRVRARQSAIARSSPIRSPREFTIGAVASASGTAASRPSAERRVALLHCVLTHHGAEGAPGRRFGSPEALALYRLNALDASVKGALEHGLP